MTVLALWFAASLLAGALWGLAGLVLGQTGSRPRSRRPVPARTELEPRFLVQAFDMRHMT